MSTLRENPTNVVALMQFVVLNKDETAAVLGVTPDTIENLHRTGQLRGVKVGKHLRWRPRDIVRFVDALENGEFD